MGIPKDEVKEKYKNCCVPENGPVVGENLIQRNVYKSSVSHNRYYIASPFGYIAILITKLTIWRALL